MSFVKITKIGVLLGIAALVVIDASFHFDKQRVKIKRADKSPQHHWSLFYPQRYTFTDASFKYRKDIENIRKLIEPAKTMLSDRATSYYLAAELPLYMRNIYGHHGRHALWTEFIGKFFACYIDQERSLEETQTFIETLSNHVEDKKEPDFKYWIVNRDSNNLNMRNDCLATRGSEIADGLPKIAKQIYQGEYLWLYELN